MLHVECQSRGTAAYSGNDCGAAIKKQNKKRKVMKTK